MVSIDFKLRHLASLIDPLRRLDQCSLIVIVALHWIIDAMHRQLILAHGPLVLGGGRKVVSRVLGHVHLGLVFLQRRDGGGEGWVHAHQVGWDDLYFH